MRADLVKSMPAEAFARGIAKLGDRPKTRGVLILGFDTEYDATTQEIMCYQLSDGYCEDCFSIYCESPLTHQNVRAELTIRSEDFTWPSLAEWVQTCMKKWGYAQEDYQQILLVSHFSTAELSHVENFWEDAQIRRVSAAQVFNATYKINSRQRLVVMDNYHFWNVGNNGSANLFAVAAKFGEAKIELPDELPIEKANRGYLGDERFLRYAIWDAVLCARVFTKFRDRLWKDYAVDIVQYPTSASLAMAVYRKHYLGESLEAPEPGVRRQAWHSLWGGRAEAYRQGDFDGEWTLRDVTSLYPSSQRLLEILPRKNDWISRLEPESWRGLCRVKFEFPPGVRFPCLPVCHDHRLIFPLEGISDCTLDEARLAKHLGAKLEFLTCYEYDYGDSSLSEFMRHFMEEKERLSEEGYVKDGSWRTCDHIGECECAMRDEVGREIDKLMMNSLIGKLSQNKGDVDIEDMKRFAEQMKIPLPVVMSPNFLHPDKPSGRFRIGGHVMPEWSALILGKARSIMAALLNDVGLSLICSTDSLLVPDWLNRVVDESMERLGVVLTNKNKGRKTSRVRIVRNRVYAALDQSGRILFGASHAIHIGSKAKNCPECKAGSCARADHNSLRFILSQETQYTKTKRLGLKSAVRSGRKFFSEEPAPMVFSREWDEKRRLLPDGDSIPWRSVEEYDETMKQRVISSKKLKSVV